MSAQSGTGICDDELHNLLPEDIDNVDSSDKCWSQSMKLDGGLDGGLVDILRRLSSTAKDCDERSETLTPEGGLYGGLASILRQLAQELAA